MWNSFIEGFCKVEMLCYQGVPNWLGWVPLGLIGIIVVGCLINFFIYLIEQDAAERKLKLDK